jgi:hypothetical protein
MGEMVGDQTTKLAAKSLREKNKMREMVGNQIANQAAKSLKKGEKKRKNNNYQFWNSRIAGSLSSVTPLASSPVCVS